MDIDGQVRGQAAEVGSVCLHVPGSGGGVGQHGRKVQLVHLGTEVLGGVGGHVQKHAVNALHDQAGAQAHCAHTHTLSLAQRGKRSHTHTFTHTNTAPSRSHTHTRIRAPGLG